MHGHSPVTLLMGYSEKAQEEDKIKKEGLNLYYSTPSIKPFLSGQPSRHLSFKVI